MSSRISVIAVLSFLWLTGPSMAQQEKNHFVLSLDDKGKLEDPKAWAKYKDDLKARKPSHIFLVAHGWKTSKERADETFSYFGKSLREMEEKDGPIEIIGVRWPSLLGESDTTLDLAFKNVARSMAGAISKAKNIDERKDKLKTFLKKNTTRVVVISLLKYQLPEDEQIDAMVDNFDEPENVEKLLATFTYYQMKKRAALVGSTGVQTSLTELQEALPNTRFHLVGHSFGCKVWLACLAAEERGDRQVDSLTLLQGAVSTHCFSAKIGELKDCPGAYCDMPKRVKGSITVSYTKNDKALSVAYVAASQSGGHVGELPGYKHRVSPDLYKALGAKGIAGVDGVKPMDLGAKGAAYKLRPGFNAFNADKVILNHGDIRREEVTWLIWTTARFRP